VGSTQRLRQARDQVGTGILSCRQILTEKSRRKGGQHQTAHREIGRGKNKLEKNNCPQKRESKTTREVDNTKGGRSRERKGGEIKLLPSCRGKVQKGAEDLKLARGV